MTVLKLKIKLAVAIIIGLVLGWMYAPYIELRPLAISVRIVE